MRHFAVHGVRRLGAARAAGRTVVLLSVLAFVAGCAVRLAPGYDKTIIDGLNKANTESLTLFASVPKAKRKTQAERCADLTAAGDAAAAAACTKTLAAMEAAHAEREKAYASVIGQFQALRLQAEARPEPRPFLAELFGTGTTDAKTAADIGKIPRLESPTPDILAALVKTLGQIREKDANGTLTAGDVDNADGGYLHSYTLSFDQVLTYEKALER